jgi:hypothetical protein
VLSQGIVLRSEATGTNLRLKATDSDAPSVFLGVFIDNSTKVEVIGEAKSESGVKFIQVHEVGSRKKGWLAAQYYIADVCTAAGQGEDVVFLPARAVRTASYDEGSGAESGDESAVPEPSSSEAGSDDE